MKIIVAATPTAAFRTSITDPITQAIDSTIPRGHFVGNSNVQDLLDQEGPVAVRIYKGLDPDDDDKMSLVMIGVDSEDEDITEGLIMDRFAKCPPIALRVTP